MVSRQLAGQLFLILCFAASSAGLQLNRLLLLQYLTWVTDRLQVWSVKINGLFEEPNMGVLLGTVTLLLGIVSRNYEGYEAVVPKVRCQHSCTDAALSNSVLEPRHQGQITRW